MSRYIDADALLAEINEVFPNLNMFNNEEATAIKMRIETMPSANVVEVRHGEWKVDTEYYDDDYSECNVRKVFRCSICGRTEMRKEPYCNCGAKMDGEKQSG